MSYHWHLRMRMAERGMYATSDLVPLLAERGVVLSREQVYRLVAKVPERINLLTLAALCDALGVQPGRAGGAGASRVPSRPRRRHCPPGGPCRASVPAGPGWPEASEPLGANRPGGTSPG